MNETATLEAGQWLGTENRIVSLVLYAKGWTAFDSTGASYRQQTFPDGLKVSVEPYGPKKQVPWPDC